VLVDAAQRIVTASKGHFVARLSGDRFAVVLGGDALPQATISDALAMIAAIRTELAQPYRNEASAVALTAGYGIVVAPAQSTSPHDVVRAAEFALSRAKRGGVDRQEAFDPHLRKQASERLTIEAALRGALTPGAADEIVTHYQPIVDLRTGSITGFEALCRWQRPGAGLVPPGVFIPVAEECGLVCDLDLLVLERAARQLMVWRERYPMLRDARISVNLSGRHFEGSALLERVGGAVTRAGAPATAIKLEVTESALISGPGDAAAAMSALCTMGVTFGLDDFGTGYSSLSYLHQFPFRTLKIDRSFVSSLGTDGGRDDLVEAILAIARSLHLDVVAEGIETPDQLAFLRDHGCEYGQGYGLARPADPATIERLLDTDPRW
jgi:Amt family ammonium transporter